MPQINPSTVFQAARDRLQLPWAMTDGLILLTIITTLACVTREIYIWGFRLRGVPCPFWNTLSCNWTLFSKGYNGTLYEWEKQLNFRHGMALILGNSQGV